VKASFNLVDEKWIPCVPISGGPTVDVSITEALTNASAYREIYDNSPLVTVSLHRLLLAVLYRACGPKNLRESRALMRDGLPVDAIRAYLDDWHDRFDLFDTTYPFYQTAGLSAKSTSSLSRLSTELATGNNATLFDHSNDQQPRALPCSEAARLLVATQSFALGFGKSSDARIGELEIKPPYSADAILLRGITVWLSSGNLEKTMLINLIPIPSCQNEVACWELDAPYELRDTVSNGQRVTHAAAGVADRYTWQSRLVRILPPQETGQRTVGDVYFTQGRSADKSADDPMKAYVRDDREGFIPITLNSAKATWRDSHALLSFDRQRFKRPQVFDHTANLVADGLLDCSEDLVVNTVGLATAPGKAGKFTLWRHDKMPAPAIMLKDVDLVERLGSLLNAAESASESLWYSARELCAAYLAVGSRKADPKATSNLAADIDPRRDYWARMETHFYALLRELPTDKDAASARWHNSVIREARAAFHRSADQLGQSGRAIRARALSM